MSPFKQSHRRDGRKNPGKLGNLRNVALSEKGGAFWIEPAGEKIDRDPSSIFAQKLRVFDACECVVIRDKIIRFTFGLKCDSRTHHTEIISYMEDTAGLNAG